MAPAARQRVREKRFWQGGAGSSWFACRVWLPGDLLWRATAEGELSDCNLGQECFAHPPSSLVWLKALLSLNIHSRELPPLPRTVLSFALLQSFVSLQKTSLRN